MATITLTVSDDTAELLRQNPRLLAAASEAVESFCAETDQATVLGVMRGLIDFEQGRSVGLDEAFDRAQAELEARMEARRSGQSGVEPRRYQVRLSAEAQQNIVDIVDHLDLWSGDADRAGELLEALRQAAGSLTDFPERIVVEEHVSRRLGVETQRMVVAHHYLLFFHARTESENRLVVRVLYIRPSLTRPLTTHEARHLWGRQQP